MADLHSTSRVAAGCCGGACSVANVMCGVVLRAARSCEQVAVVPLCWGRFEPKQLFVVSCDVKWASRPVAGTHLGSHPSMLHHHTTAAHTHKIIQPL